MKLREGIKFNSFNEFLQCLMREIASDPRQHMVLLYGSYFRQGRTRSQCNFDHKKMLEQFLKHSRISGVELDYYTNKRYDLDFAVKCENFCIEIAPNLPREDNDGKYLVHCYKIESDPWLPQQNKA